ncbi:MAG: RNA polymerase sigma factor [Planctomycetota bacterium]
MNDQELRTQLEQLHPSSYAWALNCAGRDQALAEDVLQAVYLKVLQGKAVFVAGRSEFRTWLFGVIRMTAAGERRALFFRRLWLGKYTLWTERSSATPDPGAGAGASEARRLCRAALSALAPRQRQVLHLVFYEDLTVQQAAEVLGVSVGTARQHYERGKQRLRELLKTLGENHERPGERQPSAPVVL